MTETTIVTKTARDGQGMTISLGEHSTPTMGPDWVLIVRHAGMEIARPHQLPRRMDRPVGGNTHGLSIGRDKAVGLTATEAAAIEAAVESYRGAARTTPAQSDEPTDCTVCGRPLKDFDLEASAVVGTHFDCA